MLSAFLHVANVSSGITPNQSVVTIAVGVTETDPLLAFALVGGVINFGDGTSYTIQPVSGTFGITATPVITSSLGGLNLSLQVPSSPATQYTGTLAISAFTGTFQLSWNGTPTVAIPYNASAAQLQLAINNASGGANYTISGSWPSWTISGDNLQNLSVYGSSVLSLQNLNPHIYPTGNFTVTLTASNFRVPVADEVIITAPVNLAPLANSSPTYSIIGPILPMDVGFPNPDQWDFNTSTDETVLASSVKMILLTKIGERTMLPEFGCNVYRLLFNPMTSNTGDIQKDIQDAITRWEPRVAVSSVQVSIDENGRQASVDVQLISKLTKSAFSTTVQFLA